MQNEKSYRLQGDALTASLMWVEYVMSFCICVCVVRGWVYVFVCVCVWVSGGGGGGSNTYRN